MGAGGKAPSGLQTQKGRGRFPQKRVGGQVRGSWGRGGPPRCPLGSGPRAQSDRENRDFPRAPEPSVKQAPSQRPRLLPAGLPTGKGGEGGGPWALAGERAQVRRQRRVRPRGGSGRALGRGSQRAVPRAGRQLGDSRGRVLVLESRERSGDSRVAWTGARGRCRGPPGWRSREGAFLDRARHRGHQAGQHGGPHGGDHGVRVPPAPLQPVRLQQQQGQPAPLRHAGGRPVRQARQA